MGKLRAPVIEGLAMVKRFIVILFVGVVGIAVGSLVPAVSQAVRAALNAVPLPPMVTQAAYAVMQAGGGAREGENDSHAPGAKAADAHGHGASEKEGPEGVVVISPDRIAAAGITVEPAAGGPLVRKLTVPGVIMMDADRVGHVPARVIGTVVELNKRLGDQVAKGETVAVLDSREVAEAKSELLASLVNQELQSTLFEREQSLWDKKISAEQQYLKARTTFSEAALRVDLARQKLTALGVSDREVAGVRRDAKPLRQVASTESDLPKSLGLQRYELHAPITGRVVERRVNLGAPVGGEGQEKEIYVIADLSSVWVELAVSTADLAQVREGQQVLISAGAEGLKAEARITFISPILNQDTRSARVIATMDNKGMLWRPGSFATAQVVVEETSVNLRLPRTALQTLKGEQVVFVRTEQGFEKRDVVLGKQDDTAVEVVFGLDPGEEVAIANSFVLKAELGKAEAEHAH